MKIVALLENTTNNSKIEVEHGLSLYIETEKHKILFDFGQTDLFAQNAKKLGVDIKEVDFAILSHDHYDHGGGLRCFLEINEKAPVYISRHAFGSCYHRPDEYIGLDVSLENHERIVRTGDVITIEEGITLFSCNDKERKHNLGSFGLSTKVGSEFLPDKFLHEQYLLLEENGKKVLISGCSHKGIMDIVEWLKPDVLIGGFHYSTLPLDEKLKSYAEYLDAYPTEYYTCHCTGVSQYEYM